MRVSIPVGAAETRPAGEYDYIDVVIGDARVRLEPMDLAPQSAQSLSRASGVAVIREERDTAHSAVVIQTRDRSAEGPHLAVKAWAPGFSCSAEHLGDDAVESVFALCSSMRRHGGILDHAAVPTVHDSNLLSMPSTMISTSQYIVERTEAGELSCEELLAESLRGTDAEAVEVMRGQHGPARVWEARAPDGEHAVEQHGFAARGRFCCYFETYPWLDPIPETDVAAVVTPCDNAAEPGWPQTSLPDPIDAGR